jgi:hypothetical protein
VKKFYYTIGTRRNKYDPNWLIAAYEASSGIEAILIARKEMPRLLDRYLVSADLVDERTARKLADKHLLKINF